MISKICLLHSFWNFLWIRFDLKIAFEDETVKLERTIPIKSVRQKHSFRNHKFVEKNDSEKLDSKLSFLAQKGNSLSKK